MRTIAVLNQKGGVGKTTTVVNTSAALAQRGKKVVVVDLDPQAHLTIHLGIEPSQVENGAYEVLTQNVDAKDALIEVRKNIFLMGANIDLVGAESELVTVVGREIILKEAIEKIKDDYDYMIIDCPPSLGLLSLNALAAVNEVIIPLQPHFLGLQGLGKLLETVTLVNQRINPGLKVSGVLLCMFDSRTSLSNEVKSDIEEFLQNSRGTDTPWANAQAIPVQIRRNVKLAEAPSYGKTIYEYEPNCNGANDYASVADFFITGKTEEATADTGTKPKAETNSGDDSNTEPNVRVEKSEKTAPGTNASDDSANVSNDIPSDNQDAAEEDNNAAASAV